jgi:hypothetical protein
MTHQASRFTSTFKHISQSHPGLAIALLVYLCLACAYFFIVPIFEGPDEWTHTGHVKYIAAGNGLPVMLPGQGIWGGQQPPLYYAVGALLVQPFELDGVDEYETHRRNPHASIGFALDPGNKNNYLHSPTEDFPYHGLALTVHVLRLYSMTYGLIALVFSYLTAYELFSHAFTGHNAARHFATIVALFVAVQPMFAFITASVANEPANIAFSAIGLWLAQRTVLHGPMRRWGRAVALGLTLGLISLSKMTGLSFGLVAVVAMLITALATRKQPGAARLLWRDGLIIGLLFLAVGGWWYWRNYQLYGDFFQQGLYKRYFNVDPQPLTPGEFLYTLSTGEVSFWATFGWLNIVAPNWVYSVYRVISRAGLIGVAIALLSFLWHRLQHRPNMSSLSPLPPASRFPPALILHLVFPLALAFSLTRLVAIEGGLQGRQLLPALGSLAIVIMWGWWVLLPANWRRPVMTLLLIILLALAMWLPYGPVAQAYIPHPLLREADLPENLPRLNWAYNAELKLIGVEIETAVVRPGERVPVTAYWQALKPMTTNYSVFVHLIGRSYTTAGQMNTYPGLGLRPTRTLEPGQIIVDTYDVQVAGGSDAPTRLLVNIGLFDFNEPGRPGIPPQGPAGPAAPPTAGQLKLIPTTWPAPQTNPPTAQFQDNIWLGAYSIRDCQTPVDDCRIIFEWLARGRPATDYTVFIQLWRDTAQGQIEFVTGFDAPPLANDYPTSLWQADEVIIDPHPLDLSTMPPGTYRVLAGLYSFTTGARLPITTAEHPQSDNALDLGPIIISPLVPDIK